MAELTDDIYDDIERLSAEGNELSRQRRYRQAQQCFEEAWSLLPEPRSGWSAGLWLLAAIGDMQFLRGLFEESRNTLMEAMKQFDEARENPFVRLRLGQSMLELGEEKEASNWLAGAFLMEGLKLFEGEHPRYVSFIKGQLAPPPGGWPDGW